jgi:hypothetical protein
MTLVIQPNNLRTLAWKNFQKVRRPKDDGSDASTGHQISVSANGKIVTLKLDTANTWVIVGKETSELLKHEQGHWDIYVLKAEEVEQKLKSMADSARQTEVTAIFEKYENIDRQYDDETRHGRATAKQEEWNCKLGAAKRNHMLDLSMVCEP